jgi:N-acetylglucosaminyl-diphospho-decaprenol L-rhamnosyltransferase
MLDIAVIIVSWNVRDYLVNCLRSVYADLGRSEMTGAVWLVDNASTDGTKEVVRHLFPQATLIENQHNTGFATANNQGMRAADESEWGAAGIRYFLLLNPDTLVRPYALKQLATCLEEHPHAGVAGPRLVYGDGRFQHSAFYFPGIRQIVFDLFPLPERLYESRLNGRYSRRYYQPDCRPFAVDHTLGACMLVRRDVAEATRGFDESFHMYCEEIDWCWRIRRAGWSIYTTPAAEVVHYSGQSTRQVPAQSVLHLWRSRAQLYHAHYGRLTIAVARWLVRLGLTRKARQTSDATLRQAYLEAAALWQQPGPAAPHNLAVEGNRLKVEG